MKTAIQTITPEDARKLLEKNTGNRPLRDAWVEQLVRLIREGRWEVTHQGIALAKNGRLLDGQHRLQAIMRSGRSVQIMVTTGLEEDLFKWIDGGPTRSTADRVHFVDNQQVNKLVCSLVASYLYVTTPVRGRTSIDMVEDEFLRRTDAYVYVASCLCKGVRGVCTAPVGAAVVGYYNHSQTKGQQLMESLLTGENLSAGQPVYLLREAILAGRIHSVPDRYWKTVQAAKMHETNSIGRRLDSALEDFDGNQYSTYAKLRSEAGRKSNEGRHIGKDGAA